MTEELYVESSGRGSPLVMIHGWGTHGGIWESCLPALEQRWRVIRPDLPGHGRSPPVAGGSDLDALTEVLARHCPRQMVLLGWSLGGLIAIRMAHRLPQRIRALVLVATTPRFVTAVDWPCAVGPEVLASFGEGLARDYRRTVRDFLSLQVRGDERAGELLKELKSRVFAHGDPDPQALAGGLRVLGESDLRADLAAMKTRTLLVTGDRDRITPPEATRRMHEALEGSVFFPIEGASHAPFLSHREEFLGAVTDFLEDMR